MESSEKNNLESLLNQLDQVLKTELLDEEKITIIDQIPDELQKLFDKQKSNTITDHEQKLIVKTASIILDIKEQVENSRDDQFVVSYNNVIVVFKDNLQNPIKYAQSQKAKYYDEPIEYTTQEEKTELSELEPHSSTQSKPADNRSLQSQINQLKNAFLPGVKDAIRAQAFYQISNALNGLCNQNREITEEEKKFITDVESSILESAKFKHPSNTEEDHYLSKINPYSKYKYGKENLVSSGFKDLLKACHLYHAKFGTENTITNELSTKQNSYSNNFKQTVLNGLYNAIDSALKDAKNIAQENSENKAFQLTQAMRTIALGVRHDKTKTQALNALQIISNSHKDALVQAIALNKFNCKKAFDKIDQRIGSDGKIADDIKQTFVNLKEHVKNKQLETKLKLNAEEIQALREMANDSRQIKEIDQNSVPDSLQTELRPEKKRKDIHEFRKNLEQHNLGKKKSWSQKIKDAKSNTQTTTKQL